MNKLHLSFYEWLRESNLLSKKRIQATDEEILDYLNEYRELWKRLIKNYDNYVEATIKERQ